MDANFPVLLFSSVNENPSELENEFISEMHKNAENLFKLSLKQPVDATFNEATNEIVCLTSKNFSESFIISKSKLLPWSLPNRFDNKRGINPYFDIKQKNQDTAVSVCCKKTVASFFKNRCCNATHGKCIYFPSYGVWLTPIEFQEISGSTQADWKRGIHFTSDVSEPRKFIKTFKNLVDDKVIKMHPSTCNCSACMDNDYIVDENINYLNSFFINNSNFVHLNPNPNGLGNLLVEFSNYRNITDFETRSIDDTELNAKIYDIPLSKSENPSKYKIKQISTQIIDENEMEKFFVNVCVNGTKIKTILSELNLNDSELTHSVIHKKDFNNDYIHSMSSSQHTHGECAFVFGNKSEIVLRTMDEDSNFEYISVAQDIYPNFQSTSSWKNILFGNHPRNLIYTDYSKLCSVDTRIKQSSSITELFCLNSEANKKILNINELIERNALLNSDFNAHIICCTNTLLIIDERFTQRPLITWKHHLNFRPIHLNAFSMNYSKNSFILCSDTKEIYAYQFNLNENSMPISNSFPLKVDTLDCDFETYLPKSYDKRLKRHLKRRFNQPILSMSVVNDGEKFALFQLPPNFDLYYQIFETNNSTMDVDKSTETEKQPSNYDIWLEVAKEQTMIKEERLLLEPQVKNLELNENEDIFDKYLSNYAENCKVCNPQIRLDFQIDKENEICSRCENYVEFSNSISNADNTETHFLNTFDTPNETNIVNLNDIKIPQDENDFTNTIYSIWKNDFGFA